MKVLQLNQTILKLLGIIDSKQDTNYIKMITSKYICLILPIPFLIPLIGYFLIHLTDVAEATSAFYLICITVMGFIVYLDCLANRKTVFSIIQSFQSLADTCDPNYQPFYVKCENQINKVVHRFILSLFTSVYTVFNIPIIYLIYKWLNGEFSMDLLEVPASLL